VKLPALRLNAREISDLEMIAVGAFSPLAGFMGEADYRSVRDEMRLANGLAWSIPVTLSATDEQAAALSEGCDVALYQDDHLLGVLHLEEKYRYDKEREAELVYRTTDEAHPGVRALYRQGEWLLGGPISLVNRPRHPSFPQYRRDPVETRALFTERGWRRIVAFQTRNPIHRAHEYIQKCALEIADGLLLHPLVGETKADDVPAEVRMRSYEAILAAYYPLSRTILSVLPAAMRYAGPREAVFHALIRKNYGCSHFIVGRDHAGVGNYYGTYDAHHIFDEFEPGELGIVPLFFDHTFYCRTCGAMASTKTCPHSSDNHVTLSGTRVRELLRAGQLPPREYTRPEVAAVLIEAMRAAV
jgi:sulfate adenylyltransferase